MMLFFVHVRHLALVQNVLELEQLMVQPIMIDPQI